MNDRDLLRFRHMLDASQQIEAFMNGRSRSDLEADTQLSYAVLHALQIIGEAATQVTPETKAQYPQIAWTQMTGMRHRIVHDYDNISYDIVWVTVKNDIAKLQSQLAEILTTLSSQDDDTASDTSL